MLRTKARPTPSMPVRRGGVVLGAALLLSGLVAPAVTASAAPPTSGDPAVVRNWNAFAWRVIGVEAAKPAHIAQFYLGLVSVAVYNAVVTVEGGGSATLPQPPAHPDASSDVAAATAAYKVLAFFLPASADDANDQLPKDYAAFLAGVPAGVGRDEGLNVGNAAAAALIASRTGDGREDTSVTLPPPPTPAPAGIWVPTVTPPVQFLAPWLGFTRPLLIDSATQFTVDGPDALTSPAYAKDFREVKLMGRATESGRSADQTATALFWSDNPVRQYQDAMRDRAVRHGLDIVATARMFAAVNAAGADALITCFRIKYDYNFWRPYTAIREAARDGNPATKPDPAWESLRQPPPYPEYVSGHGCISGAVARALANLFGTDDLEMFIRSEVTGTVRHFDTERKWLNQVVNARIWLGFHFRDAMDDARSVSHRIADEVVSGWFTATG
jgi:hypothetical protein